MEYRTLNPWKALFIVGLFVWALVEVRRNGGMFMFLHAVDLVPHETGHLVFSIFGNETLAVFGGTLLQVLVPLAIGAYFLVSKQWYAAAVVAFWLGQNCYDVAIYLGDARTRWLPLLGGDGVIHDWHYLLSHWGLLDQDSAIAAWLTVIGWALFITSVVAGLYFSFEPPKAEEIPDIDAEPWEAGRPQPLRKDTPAG